MLHIYGISNCDTVKKALSWLKAHEMPFVFHDYKKEGISESKLKKWTKKVGWENVFNSRSSTWKKLQAGNEDIVVKESSVIPIMLEHTSTIKRPLVEYKNKILTGFKENDYIETILNQS